MTREEMQRISLPFDQVVITLAREAACEVLEKSGVQKDISALKLRLAVCFGIAIGAGLFSSAGLLARLAM